jgi:hypothetical protein
VERDQYSLEWNHLTKSLFIPRVSMMSERIERALAEQRSARGPLWIAVNTFAKTPYGQLDALAAAYFTWMYQSATVASDSEQSSFRWNWKCDAGTC